MNDIKKFFKEIRSKVLVSLICSGIVGLVGGALIGIRGVNSAIDKIKEIAPKVEAMDDTYVKKVDYKEDILELKSSMNDLIKLHMTPSQYYTYSQLPDKKEEVINDVGVTLNKLFNK